MCLASVYKGLPDRKYSLIPLAPFFFLFLLPSLQVTGPGWSECALKGLANKPKKGDALMFYSLTPDGKKDPASLHGSCPTLAGEKWSATKWIHVAPFGGAPPPKPVDPHGCSDTHPQCAEVRMRGGGSGQGWGSSVP